ncbi:MAG TPA: HD domain-containing phosphohydrolase [Vicinamibacterales bacterium]|nr:HD domain-containing phosphohydrolase [Vicinamibacterales bacterium]
MNALVTRSPRLLVKVLSFAFAVIACVIVAVFFLFTWQTNARLTRTVAGNMEASQQRFADIDVRLRREHTLQAIALAENPTLKAAVDTYYSERGNEDELGQLRSTIETELAKLQQIMLVPALSVTDVRGEVLASVGPNRHDWPVGARVNLHVTENGAPVETVILRDDKPYVATAVPLILGRDVIGEFFLASPLNDAYALNLANEARADIAILLDGRVIASSTPDALRRAVEAVALPLSGTVTLEGEEFVVQRLSSIDAANVYALSSVTAAARDARSETGWVLLLAGAGALLIAVAGSWWLARTVARPIDVLSNSLARMAQARDFDQPLPRTSGSRELDTLTATFNDLRTAVSLAEAESEAAYLGVIGALATALDARDPYTAGHSQRVADLSVSIGRQMQLSESDLETLRLGALLHDIGKIGVSDAVLRKPTRLTPEEFEQIKLHPTLGARILKPLRFLDAQLAIVELHHERPDGRGYPHGLKGDEIPLFARIVHVADAFDAMTSARAYRAALPVSVAVGELWRFIGIDFDAQVVQAMAALPVALVDSAPVQADDGVQSVTSGALVQFPSRTALPAGQQTYPALRRAE